MCKWWVVTFVLLACVASLFATERALTVAIDGHLSATVTSDQEIYLLVTPHRGDAWTRLALRVTGDASRWKELALLNGMGDNLLTDRPIRVPLAMLRPELFGRTLRTLFPKDELTQHGLLHTVVWGGSLEGESLWKLAEWFTGDGANYAAIRKSNGAKKWSTRVGDRILIPNELLAPVLLPKTAVVETVEDDPKEDETPKNSPEVLLVSEEVSSAPAQLHYERGSEQPYAVYRLRVGEALYSSVVIRFTGRVFAKDVNEVIEQIVAYNGIADVARLPVGYPVKIPMELLTPEHRPLDDPRRVEYEQAKRDSARLAIRVAAKNLSGVHIILDAGHGGRDVGAVHGSVWESNYVYDVVCRLKKILEKKTDATVWLTTKSKNSGFTISDRSELVNSTDHVVLTTPNYLLEDPVVGVNLRWYLANSILNRAVKKSVPAEKVVFISVHADSLHSSLRGAMAYIPGERYVRGTFTKTGQVYLTRSEVRENPTVTHSSDDALRAEGLSLELARSVMAAFESTGMKLHPFSPIRTNVIRQGREWVPAIIRYNKVPTRMLLEICNLGNREDRKLIQTRSYRQSVAEAVHEGISDFFAQQAEELPSDLLAARSAAK